MGTRLGRFRIARLIGKGGMGEVYAAVDEQLDREVAIKVLGAAVDVEPHRRRFLREARLAARLNHPNIASIYEVGDTDGRLYIVMELLEGEPLRALLTERRLKLDETLAIARDVARALARAHVGEVIHRDIKPENIFITSPAPDVLFAKVLDFGLARDELLRKTRGDDENTATDLTGPGEACGTAGYLAPEQARGLALDIRADIFSFGAVLYEMITGKRAFDGRNQLQRMLAVVKHEPQPVRELAPDIPAELEHIVARCLAKEPAKRYADGNELLVAIEQLLRASQRSMASHDVSVAPAGASTVASVAPDPAASGSARGAPSGAVLGSPGFPSGSAPGSPSGSASGSPSGSAPASPSGLGLGSESESESASTSAAILATGESSDAGDEEGRSVRSSVPGRDAARSPIPFPALASRARTDRGRQVKPLLMVAAGGFVVSLVIILALSATRSSSEPKKAVAVVLPRAAEVAAAREMAGAADGVVDKAVGVTTDANDGAENAAANPTSTDDAVATNTSTNASANAPPTATPNVHAGFTKLPAQKPSAPAAPPQTSSPTPMPAPPPRATTGTVFIKSSDLMTIVVDGEYRRLNAGKVVVSCGRHRVRVGLRSEQVIDVPCGGTIAL